MSETRETVSQRFWTERSVPGSPSWPFFRGRFLSRYRYAYPFVEGRRALDVASGVGYGSSLLATEGKAREVHGVEIDANALAYARQHYAATGVQFHAGNCQELSTMNLGRFDAVTSMGTLEHIEQPDLFAEGVRSVLTPGGVWILTMLNPAVHKEQDPYHFQELDASTFGEFLRRHFSDVKVLAHRLRASGREKREKDSARFARIPAPIKTAAKSMMGLRLWWKISLIGAPECGPEDYEFAPGGHADALEYMAVCSHPR